MFAQGIERLPGRMVDEFAEITDSAEIKTRLFAECRQIRQWTAEEVRTMGATGNHLRTEEA